MTVANTEPIFFRRFNGHVDPALPEGWWFGSVSVTGDGTGGIASLSLALAPVSDALNSRIFSLEQLSVSSTATAGANVRFQGTNLVGPGPVNLDMFFGAAMVVSDASVISAEALNALPLFLGSAADRAQQASYSAVLPNSDMVVFDFEAQGYWWGPRSVLVDGGPQRPLRSVYGA